MSEREIRRARASMKPFIQLMLAVMCLTMIAGCGGSGEEVGSTTVQGSDFLRPSSENVAIDAGGGLKAMKGEILATKASGATMTQINTFFEKMGWDVVGYISDSETWQIDTKTATKTDMTEAVQKAQESGLFSLVTKNYAWGTNAFTTNDPLIAMNDRPALWDKTVINAASAWELLYSGEAAHSDVKIGVVDTTFVEHEDISFEDLDPAGYREDTDHGMHVSGIIAAKGGNSVGTAGVAWSNKGIHLYPASVSMLSITELVTQAKYMRNKAVRVVNLSWGMNECKPAADCTEDAIATALKSYVQQLKKQLLPLIRSKEGLDIIFVQGAGNVGWQSFTNSNTKLDTSL
jgi:hypothetical protein